MIKLSGISRFGLLCGVASVLSCMQGAYAQNQSFFWEPEDPPYEGYPQIGTGVAVSGHTAAVGAPQYYAAGNPDTPENDPAWVGLVNVYVADAGRTRWKLLTVLHADDASRENQEFGKAIAMEGRRLVVATNATLRVYERRSHNYELLDTVVLSDATVPESTPIQFVKDVLAISVLNNSGGSSVRVFRINPRGKARAVASLSPPGGGPDSYDVGGLSLDADARTLAVGLSGRGRVYLYEACSGTWKRTESVAAPSSTAAGFGSSVALRGNRLVVGAPSENHEIELEENYILWGGAVHVYRRVNNRWVRVQRLASNDPAQSSYGLVAFGSEIVTNGRYVWITSPSAHYQYASDVQMGPASLYRWNAGRLEYVTDGPNSLSRGGIDMSWRYVIEGDIYGSIHQLEGAHIVDLSTIVPTDTDAEIADESATSSPAD